MRKIIPVISRKLSHICTLKPYKDSKWFMPNGNPTGIYIYNCVANQKVPLILNEPHMATWYSCGPTVYDSAHLGHASCYVKLDIIQRILRSFLGIKLVTAMGITDIDDKIIKKGIETKTDYRKVATQYEHEFWLDMAKLNVEKPLIITRVSEHINTIQKFIQKLIDSEIAYVSNDGSVYFNTAKYPAYGKLQKAQDSGEPLDKHKRNKMDFALWKAHKPGEPHWKTSWGQGRPGWHIECSAMVSQVFGRQIDFHAGGQDLQFPHHENEEAQSCSYHNTKQWANYWIHIGHLHSKDDQKMSKSLKNTISVSNLLEKHSSAVFRLACLMSNYKYTMEYSEESMSTARNNLNKIKFFLKDVTNYLNNNAKQNGDYKETMIKELQQVELSNLEALRSDFDTSTCVNNILNLINNTNKVLRSTSTEFYPVHVVLITEYITSVFQKFGVDLLEESSDRNTSNALINSLVEFRHKVRLNAISRKDKELLSDCDLLRDKLKTFKVQINDNSKNPTWVFKE